MEPNRHEPAPTPTPEAAWPFDHPPRGSCEPACPAYGRCHCGCAVRPRRSPITDRASGRVAGRPSTFAAGHHVRVHHPRSGCWSTNGVEVDRVRPLLFFLRLKHGTVRRVAAMLQMPEATVRGYLYNRRRKRVPPAAARRIVTLVLAHRKRSGPLDIWEEAPGFLRETVLRELRGA